MENSENKFIKLFDERIANALSVGGFSYTQEKINGNQTVYCFEKCPGVIEVIRSFCDEGHYEDIIAVEDGTLLF